MTGQFKIRLGSSMSYMYDNSSQWVITLSSLLPPNRFPPDPNSDRSLVISQSFVCIHGHWSAHLHFTQILTWTVTNTPHNTTLLVWWKSSNGEPSLHNETKIHGSRLILWIFMQIWAYCIHNWSVQYIWYAHQCGWDEFETHTHSKPTQPKKTTRNQLRVRIGVVANNRLAACFQ